MSTIETLTDFVSIPLDLLRSSPTNPRKRFDPRDLDDLAANVRELGILQPLVVRALEDGTFEVVAGERRLRAARIAALPAAPCVARDLSDEDVWNIQVAENNQREDVTPLEEADAIRRGVETLGRSVDAIAKQLGRSTAYVAARYLIACAPESVRSLLDDGLVTVGAATVLARAPGSKVDTVASRARKQAESKGEPLSRRDIALLVDQYAHLLADAPFDLADTKLTRLNARPCTTCTDRTGAQGALFSDASGDDRCLDLECWDAKVSGLWERARKDAKKRRLTVLDEPWDGSHTGYYEARSTAMLAGRSEPWSSIVDPGDIVIGRASDGRIVELVGPATVGRFRAARFADEPEESAGATETDAEREARLARAREQRDRDSLERHYSAQVQRLLERFDAEVADVDALRVLARPHDGLGRVHALHLGLIQPGGPEAGEALATWLRAASQRELVRLLMATALIDGWLDDDETLDGLLEPSAEEEETHG